LEHTLEERKNIWSLKKISKLSI